MTVTEAKARGLTFSRTPPEDTTCEFCGALREAHGLLSPFDQTHVGIVFSEPKPCTCEGAQEARARELAAEEARELEARETARQEHAARLLKASGLPPRFAMKTFDTFEVDETNEKAYKVAHRWAATYEARLAEGRGLSLVGDVDRGKTHLAAAVTLELLAHGVPTVFTTTIDLLGLVKRSFSDPHMTEDDIVERMTGAAVLVLDDLGKEPPTDWALSILFRIVNGRYAGLKPLVVTTQYGDDELVRRLAKNGDTETARALVSRIHEMCYRVECNGRNHRGKA